METNNSHNYHLYSAKGPIPRTHSIVEHSRGNNAVNHFLEPIHNCQCRHPGLYTSNESTPPTSKPTYPLVQLFPCFLLFSFTFSCFSFLTFALLLASTLGIYLCDHYPRSHCTRIPQVRVLLFAIPRSDHYALHSLLSHQFCINMSQLGFYFNASSFVSLFCDYCGFCWNSLYLRYPFQLIFLDFLHIRMQSLCSSGIGQEALWFWILCFWCLVLKESQGQECDGIKHSWYEHRAILGDGCHLVHRIIGNDIY